MFADRNSLSVSLPSNWASFYFVKSSCQRWEKSRLMDEMDYDSTIADALQMCALVLVHDCWIEEHALVVDLLEDILEAPVVALEDGVLRAHVHRPLLLQTVLQTGVREAPNWLCNQWNFCETWCPVLRPLHTSSTFVWPKFPHMIGKGEGNLSERVRTGQC